MFVPFVFDLYTYREMPHLWIFYKCLDFAKTHDFPIIAQETYAAASVSESQTNGRLESTNQEYVNDKFLYRIPTDKDLQYDKIYQIPNALVDSLVRKRSSINDTYIDLLQQEDDELTNFLQITIDQIETDCNQKIEGILCFQGEIKSLSRVAKDKRIPLIHWELSCIRHPLYVNTAYLDFDDLYGGKTIRERWKAFSEERQINNMPLFSKRECLALLLNNEFLYLIDRYSNKPSKEIGVALSYTSCELTLAKTHFNDSELLFQLKNKYGSDNLLIRKHPGDPLGSQYPIYTGSMEEKIENSAEFCLNCETVASLCSGTAMEAMLFNRKAITLLPCPSYFASGHDLDGEGLCAGEEYVNFFTFCYLIPLEYLMDVNYLRWRLTMPSEHEIYHKHLEFYFRKKALPLSLIQKPAGDRLNAMLAEQGYHPKDVAEVERQKEEVEHKMAEEIAQKEEQIAQKEEEIRSLRSSVSYRVGRMITWLPRKVRGGIKRLFR